MIFGNVELHNVAELTGKMGPEGARLQRVPETVRTKLNAGAQARMLSPANAEIRFVMEGGSARVTLSSTDETLAVVFHGVFQVAQVHRIGKEKQVLDITMPDRPSRLGPADVADMPFSPRVCRIMLGGGPVRLHAVEGEGIRPPAPDELPRLRYLAYGTSITHGAAATAPHLSYVAQTACRLGADLINLGVGGSALCEPELADYMAARKDWDVATLALSVNMIGHGFDVAGFEERVAYMVNAVGGATPPRPVAAITIYPHFRDLKPFQSDGNNWQHSEAFRDVLRDVVARCPHSNVHLVEGADVLPDMQGLTPDLIHPADNGMIRMGENLANALRPILRERV